MLLLYNIADLSCTCGAGEGRGFLKAHRTATQMLTKYLKVEQASSLATDTAGTNQLCPRAW